MEDKQWEETIERVRQHLPEFNPFHTSLTETIVMLLDELDETKETLEKAYERISQS